MPLHSVTLRVSGCQPRKARRPTTGALYGSGVRHGPWNLIQAQYATPNLIEHLLLEGIACHEHCHKHVHSPQICEAEILFEGSPAGSLSSRVGVVFEVGGCQDALT